MANRVSLTIDLSDRPDLADGLRVLAAHENTTQKALVREALEALLARRQENAALLDAARAVFTEWESEEDKVYDSL